MLEQLELRLNSLYHNNRQLLGRIHQKVYPKDRILIVGATGSGKSSLLSTLNLMNQGYTGEILFAGTNIKQMKPELLRSRICMVMQEPYLEDASIGDILDLPLQYNALKQREMPQRKQHIKELMHRFQLPEDFLMKQASTLSGGEKQRIALIRVLQLNPEILLLDEISSALDQTSSGIISDFLFNSFPGTVIAISHDPLWQSRWQKIWKLDSGTISFLTTGSGV